MTAQEQYLARVNGLLDSVSATLSREERAEVQHLINHGEPAEGLRALAWIIVKGGKHVAPEVIADIRTLSKGLVPEEHMPSSLDEHAVQPEWERGQSCVRGVHSKAFSARLSSGLANLPLDELPPMSRARLEPPASANLQNKKTRGFSAAKQRGAKEESRPSLGPPL